MSSNLSIIEKINNAKINDNTLAYLTESFINNINDNDINTRNLIKDLQITNEIKYFVDQDVCGNSGDGLCWKHAFKSLTDAFNVIENITAQTNVNVYIRQGVYTGNYSLSNTNINLTIIGGQNNCLKKRETTKNTQYRTILKGEPNVDTSVLSLSQLGNIKLKNLTVCKGENNGINITDVNNVTICNISACNNNITIFNFSSNGSGVGLRILNANNVIIKNSKFNHNKLITLSNSFNNSTGGGIYLSNIYNVELCNVFANNNLLNHNNYGGGGIGTSSIKNIKLNNVTTKCNKILAEDENINTVQGGGIYLNNNDNIEINNSNISNNILEITSNDSITFGGGIFIISSNIVKILNTKINNNKLISNMNENIQTFARGSALYLQNITNNLKLYNIQVCNNKSVLESNIGTLYMLLTNFIATIEKSIFKNNNLNGETNLGGAIAVQSNFSNLNNLLVKNNKFINNNIDNTPTSHGSAAYITASFVSKSNYNFTNNLFCKNGELGTDAVIYHTVPITFNNNLFKCNKSNVNIL